MIRSKLNHFWENNIFYKTRLSVALLDVFSGLGKQAALLDQQTDMATNLTNQMDKRFIGLKMK